MSDKTDKGPGPWIRLAACGWLAVASGVFADEPSAPASPPQATPPQAGSHPADASRTPAKPAKGAQPTTKAKAGAKVHPYHPDRFAGRAGEYYRLVWGVDSLAVKWAESGEVIRFTYRILDADKAKTLNDGRNEPSLNDPRAGVKLVVPALENVGQLRQKTTPESGKTYWILFSNKGRPVKRGDHVAVVIGAFHADGLVVD